MDWYRRIDAPSQERKRPYSGRYPAATRVIQCGGGRKKDHHVPGVLYECPCDVCMCPCSLYDMCGSCPYPTFYQCPGCPCSYSPCCMYHCPCPMCTQLYPTVPCTCECPYSDSYPVAYPGAYPAAYHGAYPSVYGHG
ncbi:hypothetical protein KIPB_015872, partial [Kipferlia bialata]|eukprot:g15872.t1